MQAFIDQYQRRYRKLRISVTDRCQFRCTYCMPDGPSGGRWLPRNQLLSFEEITEFVRLVAPYGLHDIRLTGGEPLLRRDLAHLVAMLTDVTGIRSVALTSNGVLLPQQLPDLIAAGLNGVTVSIDSLNPDRFRKLSGGAHLEAVKEGIAALADTELTRKLNAVVIRDQNDDELCDLIRYAAAHRAEIRFIEYMPFGSQWGWDAVIQQDEILARIASEWGALLPVPVDYGSTSRRWRIPSLNDTVFGIIPTMGETLCSECDRLRLTADGRVLNCLFDAKGIDVRTPLRQHDAEAVLQAVQSHLDDKGRGYLAEQHRHWIPLDHMHRVGG